MGFACASPATLNRLELGVRCLPSESDVLVLDFDATDDPLHGHQEGRFFHGYYGNYCYLPLYCFCVSVPLWAQLRSSDKDASTGTVEALEKLVAGIRRRFPKVKIVVRGDSGFAREAIMAWCEAQRDVFYLLGMARNRRLEQLAGGAALRAAASFCLTGVASRSSMETPYRTCKSWSRERVIGLEGSLLAGATLGSVRLRLLIVAALVQESVRRVHVALCSACPLQDVFRLAASRLQTCAPPRTS